jgi:D-alanine-D-alanine ligase
MNGMGEYRLEARIPIPMGGLIIKYEESDHVLVSRRYQAEHWDAQQKEWFARFAWPLTDEIYVSWSTHPDDWLPINHSCEPNAWLDGLNLVARRDIEKGEEISTDYATFYNETMQEFSCSCGSHSCRGTIRGTDYLQPFVERYGDHISDYVRRRRNGDNGVEE